MFRAQYALRSQQAQGCEEDTDMATEIGEEPAPCDSQATQPGALLVWTNL